MTYRAKIYIRYDHGVTHVTTITRSSKLDADTTLFGVLENIEQATGGHIEQYVDGIGWVVCEEETND